MGRHSPTGSASDRSKAGGIGTGPITLVLLAAIVGCVAGLAARGRRAAAATASAQ